MSLTHWDRGKLNAILQKTLSNAFSWMEVLEFLLKFHWNLFLGSKLTIFQHWFRQWLVASQTTSHYLNQWLLDYWRIYASLGLNALKFDGWPRKTIGHLFYATSNCVHQFKATGEFKLELHWRFFVPCDLKIWHMNLKKEGHLFYATSRFVYHSVAINEFKLELQSVNVLLG